MKNIRVLKYGGTSLANLEKIQKIAEYISKQNEKIVVVVSAMNKTTDELLNQIFTLDKEPPKHEIDMLISTGEQNSAALLATAINFYNKLAISSNAHSLNIKSCGPHTKAKIQDIDVEKIYTYLEKFDVIVVTGFQGIDEVSGEITTLGRGGSDLSAVAIASILGVDVEIYTDTTGVFTIDPRINAKAKQIDYLTYDEMMEMAIKGSGVLEPRSVALAKKYKTKIYLAKSMSKIKGTYVVSEEKLMEKKVISGISIDKDIIYVKIENFDSNNKNMKLLFDLISKFNINVDMISQNELKTIGFTCDENEKSEIIKLSSELQKSLANLKIKITNDLNKVSLIGIGMNQESGIASRVFNCLATIDVNTKLITTSNISISLLVNENNALNCANILTKEFNLEGE